MKGKLRLICSLLVLSLIIMSPVIVRAESSVLPYDMVNQLFEQLQALELMKRNVEGCYQAEKRTPLVAGWSGQSWMTDGAELDGKLMNRVLGHLAGTPEYKRFIVEYRTLIQRPDYRRLHADELFVAYMRLLESGRTRFFNQLKELRESLGKDGLDQIHKAWEKAIPGKLIPTGYPEFAQGTESGRVVPAIRPQAQIPLSDSTPLAVGRESVLGIVVPGMDQFGSAGTAPPTNGFVELHTLVALERTVVLEKIPMGYPTASSKGFDQEPVRVSN